MTGRGTDRRVLQDDMARYAATIARWVAKGHGTFADEETGSRATIERQFEQFEAAANALGASFLKANPGIPQGDIFEIRNDLSHPYERSYHPEKLWRFAVRRLPRIARRLRRPNFPDEQLRYVRAWCRGNGQEILPAPWSPERAGVGSGAYPGFPRPGSRLRRDRGTTGRSRCIDRARRTV